LRKGAPEGKIARGRAQKRETDEETASGERDRGRRQIEERER
jgi:hypothetical protein